MSVVSPSKRMEKSEEYKLFCSKFERMVSDGDMEDTERCSSTLLEYEFS